MICKLLNNEKLYKKLAFALIIFSFLLYALMPLNLCLPLSYCVITALTVVMAIVSEVSFWVGGLMLGKDVVTKIRKKIRIGNMFNLIKTKRRKDR